MRTPMLQYLYLQKPVTMVIVICLLSLLPWLGAKHLPASEVTGEVRSAVSILETGEWTLTGDRAPLSIHNAPMLSWLIAATSLPAGHVTAFSARLPSMVAFMMLVGILLVFYGQRVKFQEAFISVLLLISCFGMHRAAIYPESDLLFALFVIMGLIGLFRWEEKLELKGLPVFIPFFLGCAVLTKGIFGYILPAAIFTLYLLIRQKYRLRTIVKVVLYTALSTSFLPALWYIAAWKEGGHAFAVSVLSDNLGYVFTGKFSELGGIIEQGFVHFLTGFLPWILFVVLSAFGLRSFSGILQATKDTVRKPGNRLRAMQPVKLFSLVAMVCSMVFCMFSSAKQGAYLTVALPFIMLFLAQYILYQKEFQPIIMRVFAGLMATAAFAVIFLFILHSAGVFGEGSELRTTIQSPWLTEWFAKAETLFNLSDTAVMAALFILLLTASTLVYQMSKKIHLKILYAVIAVIISMYVLVDCMLIYNIPVGEQTSGCIDVVFN